MKSFADKIVALAATIGREREIAIRKLCDDVDRRIKKLEEANKNIAYHLNEVMQLVRMNTGEESSTRKGDVTTARDGTVTTTTVHERDGSDYSSPDPIPDWVPSAEEICDVFLMLSHTRDIIEGCNNVRRLIASRDPAPQVVDVKKLLDDYYETNRYGAFAVPDMTRALKAQGVRTKNGAP